MRTPTDTAAPPPPRRRELGKADRRRRLFDAAMRLYVERGYDAVTVEQITDAAGVAKGTFFNYYPTKSHILLEYHARVLAEALAAGARMRGTSARVLFGRFLRKIAAIARRDGPAFDLLVRQVLAQPQLSAADERSAPAVLDLYGRFLAAGVASGEVRPDVDANLASVVVGDLWTGTILEWVFGGRSFRLERRLLEKLDLLFQGLAAGEKKKARAATGRPGP